MKIVSSACVLAIVLSMCAPPAPAADFDTGKLHGLGEVHFHLLESATLGRPLHIYVRIPDGANDNPSRRFPAVYLLDGGTSFPLLSGWYHYLRFGEEVPEMLLVGISYGSDSFESGNFRSADFTAPAEEREWWGGAPKFQQALEQELIPLVETYFPADPGRRVLLGQSLGGQFVLYSALTRPDLFWGHIASNPALHRNLDFFLEWRGGDEMPVDATRLFVAEGEFNDTRFKLPFTEWARYWTSPGRSKPFVLEVRALPGQSHFSSITEAFRSGSRWLFGDKP
jgi:predicted alpha/beta superfamily hydrolase